MNASNHHKAARKGIEGYLQKQKSRELTGHIPVVKELSLIVVIPCFNEPDVNKTIESLANCDFKGFGVEIILLINSYEGAPESIKAINRATYNEMLHWANLHHSESFQLIPLLEENIPDKQPGAGIPRKMAMDEALRRFVRIDNSEGIIVSLDADCTVDSNYLSEIFRHFKNDNKVCTATIHFHHPVEHLPEGDPIRKAITVYETYLHYYRAALESCGYPYAYHTIGSAFAVKAITYAQAGGMGKQQGGEDFYFLQKVFPLGKTAVINSTTVYPAARLSERVPFGTGPALANMLKEEKIEKYTYSLEAFNDLKMLFSDIQWFFKSGNDQLSELLSNYPQGLRLFLEEDHFTENIQTINKNTSSLKAFEKHFFNYFNAFKILKYLNYVHPKFYKLKKLKVEN